MPIPGSRARPDAGNLPLHYASAFVRDVPYDRQLVKLKPT